MMPAKIVEGDIFESGAKYLCHQCNCVTRRAKHLSFEVFRRYPWADIYASRKHPDKPGEIIVRGNGADQRFVINILGQYLPGRPGQYSGRYERGDPDEPADRENYFREALARIVLIARSEPSSTFAFPWGIGCGAAGGNWELYRSLIDNIADKIGPERVEIWRLR